MSVETPQKSVTTMEMTPVIETLKPEAIRQVNLSEVQMPKPRPKGVFKIFERWINISIVTVSKDGTRQRKFKSVKDQKEAQALFFSMIDQKKDAKLAVNPEPANEEEREAQIKARITIYEK